MKKLLYESTTAFLYRIVIFFTFVSGDTVQNFV